MSTEHRRVAITGLGVVSSLGVGKKAFWDSLCAGRSGVRSLEDEPWMNREFRSRVGAPVKGFDPESLQLSKRELNLLDPASVYALAAARMAVEDAGIPLRRIRRRQEVWQLADIDLQRVATVLGTGIGGLPTWVEAHAYWHVKRVKSGCKRYWLPMLIPNASAAQVSIYLQALGECKSITTACASGTMAVGDAARLIHYGSADVVLAGGTEATLSDRDGFGFMGFDLLRTMSERNDEPEKASRPFDTDRDGFVLGEGSAVLVLEEWNHAKERGAPIYAELCGYFSNAEGYHMVLLDPEVGQICNLLRGVLADAGAAPSDVDYINAHGTSTRVNDPNESRAIREVFEGHADALRVSSTKSMTGHGIAASGALEAVATAMTLHSGRIHPTMNLETPDPECTLDYVPGEAVDAQVRTAISTSYGFGGHNAAILLRKADEGKS